MPLPPHPNVQRQVASYVMSLFEPSAQVTIPSRALCLCNPTTLAPHTGVPPPSERAALRAGAADGRRRARLQRRGKPHAGAVRGPRQLALTVVCPPPLTVVSPHSGVAPSQWCPPLTLPAGAPHAGAVRGRAGVARLHCGDGARLAPQYAAACHAAIRPCAAAAMRRCGGGPVRTHARRPRLPDPCICRLAAMPPCRLAA